MVSNGEHKCSKDTVIEEKIISEDQSVISYIFFFTFPFVVFYSTINFLYLSFNSVLLRKGNT